MAGCAHYTPRPLAPDRSARALEARTLTDPGLRAFLERSLGQPLPRWPLRRWDLEQLTLAAFYYSPALDLARARLEAARAAIVSAGALPNPDLGLIPGYSTNAPAGISPWLPATVLEIPIETAGKRGVRVAQARDQANAAVAGVVTTAWHVRSRLIGALIGLTAARERTRLLRRQLDLEARAARLEQGELAAGAVAGSDLAAIRIELARSRLDLDTSRAALVEARARCAGALGVPLRSLDGVQLAFSLRPAAASNLTKLEARRRALRRRSDVLAALAQYEAAQEALRLQIARQYPNIRVGPGYQWEEGREKWTLGLTLTLPVLNRNQGPIAQARARRREAAARFVALQSRILNRIDAALAALRVADRSLSSAQSLLSAERQGLQGVRNEYAAGSVGELEMISAQMAATTGERLALEARVRREVAVRALENVLQQPLGSPQQETRVVMQIATTERPPR